MMWSRMEQDIIAKKSIRLKGIVAIYPANSVGDDIEAVQRRGADLFLGQSPVLVLSCYPAIHLAKVASHSYKLLKAATRPSQS